MDARYQKWIDDKRASGADPNGHCESWTKEMAEAFPELSRVRGHVWVLFCPEQRPHWWLATKDGEIVDPTVSQFSDPNYIYGASKVLDYEPWDESQPEPVGKCMQCGDLVFTYEFSGYACSDDCRLSLEGYYNCNFASA